MKTAATLQTLVATHVDLVYAAALRQVRDPHLADDITQTVFLVLARKIDRLPPEPFLASWLLKVTRYTAISARRSDMRRRRDESLAAADAPRDVPPIQHEAELAALLDEALMSLGESDRLLVIARYLQNRPLEEIAAALNLRANTTAKRLERALDKLRHHLRRRGLTAATLSTLPTVLVSTSLQKSPEFLAAKILAASGIRATAASSFGVFLMTAPTKLKLALAILLAALVIISATCVLFHLRNPSPHSTSFIATPPASSVSGNFVAWLKNIPTKTQGEIIAITSDRHHWWSPDGSPFPTALAGTDFSLLRDPYHEQRTMYQFAIRLTDLPATAGTVYLHAYGNPRVLFNVSLQRDSHDPLLFYAAALLYPEQKITGGTLHFSTRPWEKIILTPAGKVLTPLTRLPLMLSPLISTAPGSIEDIHGNAAIRLGLEPFGDYEYNVFAIATDGTPHRATDAFTGPFTDYHPIWSFDVPLRDIQRFEITIRVVDQSLQFEQLSLVANQLTDPYSTTESRSTRFDNKFFNLQFEISHQLQLNNSRAAAAVADILLAQATQRRAKLLDTPDLYLIDKGLPLLTQLRDALRAGDLRKANAVMDTSTGTGFRLQRALQAIAEN